MVGLRDVETAIPKLSKTLARSTQQVSPAPLTDTAESFARSIVDALSAHIAVLDETGAIIAVNRAWREFAEANPPLKTNVFEGANYLRVCDTADGPGAEAAAALAAGIRAIMQDQEHGFTLEYPCHAPHEKRWFVARVSRFPGDGPTRVVVAHENVTARKQAEEALSVAEQRSRSLYEKSSDAFMTLDPCSGLFTSANPSAIAMFGARDEGDFLSRGSWEYSSARQPNGRDSAELIREIIEATLREGYRLIEWTCTRVDGTEFPATVLLTRIDCAGATIIQATVRDKTLEKQAEAESQTRLLRQENISLLQQTLLTPAPLGLKLKIITDAIVWLFDVDYCRIWLIRPGDLCETGCMHAEAPEVPDLCLDRSRCLHLAATSGKHATVGNADSRVPLCCYEIGQIVSGDEHKVTINDVQDDLRIHDREWARNLKLESFAGYQLRGLGGETLGVLALFAGQQIHADEQAMIDGLSSTAALIVQQAAAEEELLNSKNRYNALFRRSLALVHIFDFEGRTIDANDAIFDRLGFSREELRCLDLASLLSEDQLPLAFKTIQEIRETGNQKNPAEFRLRHKDGTCVFVETTGSAIFSEGNVVAIQMIGNDITDRKRAEEESKQLFAELDRSNKELEQFAYVASHDLQEPLRMVSSYTQLLARRYKGRLDADADEFIAFAVDGAFRMQRLINDLLSYSRVGSRGKEFESTDCAVFFEQAITNLKGTIGESGAVVTCGKLPTVMADKSQIGQLLQNLVGNAIKYHGVEPPRVHVSAEQKGEEWVFAVRDNGIGIDPQYADRIFVIFQRLHTREEYTGTGIGLAICKKIVERHGGRIWLESLLGSGATFYFTIPTGNKGPLQSVWVEKRSRPRHTA